MTPAEIEHSALHGAELPDKLTGPEQFLFLSFRQLYRDFHAGSIDRDQAHREKLRILKGFDDFNRLRDMYASYARRWNRAEMLMPEVERSRSDCPTCNTARKIIEILDGRDKST